MTNEIMKAIEELKGINKLYNTVVCEVLDDSDSEEKEDVVSRLSEILENGCQSGTVGTLIYYSDTIKFYEEHKEEINALLYDNMENTGLYSLTELFSDKFEKEDPLCIEQTNQNLLAWFAYEEVARNMMLAINPEY